jgi:hypothetical protein
MRFESGRFTVEVPVGLLIAGDKNLVLDPNARGVCD